MIKFIQDYTTKALPPEHFEKDQQVSRSPESEQYLVQLGVAGFLIDGVLVDQDYKPIVPTLAVVEVVSPGDRRFADGGRAGEVLGLAAPQRASTGPGNAALFGVAAQPEMTQVEFDQLRSDLAASAAQFDDHRAASEATIVDLRAELERARLADAGRAKELAAAHTERGALKAELDAANTKLGALDAEIARLKTATREGETGADSRVDAAPAKPGRGR